MRDPDENTPPMTQHVYMNNESQVENDDTIHGLGANRFFEIALGLIYLHKVC